MADVVEPIALGMVGGGEGAFIGAVHRTAARMDGHFRLVAGALSSDPARAEMSAASLGLQRSYADFRQMAAAEAARPGTPGSFLSHRLEAHLTRRDEPAEEWAGEVRGPRVQLALASPDGEIAATRMFGYVSGRLMWLWEHRRPVPDGAAGETALTPYLSLEMHRV